MHSWIFPEQSRAKPVCLTAITSEWSPNMLSAPHANDLAETWNTVGVSSPARRYIVGIISSRPCEAVKVVTNAPETSAPWIAPAAPPSDCISVTDGIVPHMFA